MEYGKVYIVGAGPGNPKLLTLRALEVLREADLIIYDRLVGEEILKLIPEGAEKIYAGKSPREHMLTQEEINRLMVKAAMEGKIVVRLKGGDPFLFGRGGEEAEFLAANNIPFEIIPGVSSALAVPAYAGIPVTHRNYSSSVAIVTGSQAADATRRVNWRKLSEAVDTIVVLMGLENLADIVRSLLDAGLKPETPTAIIEWGTTDKQRTLIGQLSNIAEKAKRYSFTSPSIIVIGEVVKLGWRLTWFKKPLT